MLNTYINIQDSQSDTVNLCNEQKTNKSNKTNENQQNEQ